MVICTKCGFQNPDNAGFCGSCGSFLEWTGEKVAPPAAPAPEPAPAEPAPEHGGLIVSARRVLGLDARHSVEGTDAAAGASSDAPTVSVSGPTVPVAAAPAPVVISTRRVTPAVDFTTEDTPAEAAPVDPAAAAASPAVSAADEAAPAIGPVPPSTTTSPEWRALAVEPPPARPFPFGPQPTTPVAPAPSQPLAVKPGAVAPQPLPRVVPAQAVQSQPVGPDAGQPEAVKPGTARPRPAPTSVVPVEEAPRPGELICASCGTGNEATRRFCRRCGATLTAMPVARRVPWWRRLFVRRATATPAGVRPQSVQQHAAEAAGGRGSLLFKVLALVLVGAIVGGTASFVLIPGFHDAVTGAANQIRIQVAPNYVPVHVAGQANGPSIPGHGASKAFDGFSNTYWAASANANQPSIRATFSPPADIAKVLVTAGDSDDFQAQPRPHTIRLDFMDASSAVVFTQQFDLQDTKDFQTLDVNAKGAASVTITVLSVYQSTSGKNVSITEVEFRSRQ